MKLLKVIAIIVVLLFIYFLEEKSIQTKKERNTFLSLLMINVLLATIIVFFPSVPGPTRWIEFMYQSIKSL